MNLKVSSSNCLEAPPGEWRIVVNSLGEAGAALLGALKQVSPLPESQLAALLYQAPSELFGGLSRTNAEQINATLRAAGLESDVIARDAAFTPGDAEHEVALVVRDYGRMPEVARLVMEILGVGAEQARRILCASPTVLLGKISANTVAALQDRFSALDVELDVSRASTARFDLFLGDCGPTDHLRLGRVLGDLNLPLLHDPCDRAAPPLLALGLSRAEAEPVWEQVGRSRLPLRLVNRDFERFDLRLDEAPRGPEMADFLMATTGMPERIARKVLEQIPIVTHQSLRFAELENHLAAIAALGGRASGHLLAFQTFSLELKEVGDRAAAAPLLQALGGLTREEALDALGTVRLVDAALTPPQALWLQHELKRVGTVGRLVLR